MLWIGDTMTERGASARQTRIVAVMLSEQPKARTATVPFEQPRHEIEHAEGSRGSIAKDAPAPA
ncbi:hypothetical protein ACQQ2N_14795 [Dokdonella sp. MW10]|uniref:hypothetical protein n=1 Tax=Dokdonella sp. MW10 TaxID=2992926 RepID=UPI003F81C923